jgi:hypothetical protein
LKMNQVAFLPATEGGIPLCKKLATFLIFLFGFLFASILFQPRYATAGLHIPNPLKVVENAAGSVARGVGNIFGQGLAGLAAPVVNETGDKIQDVANSILAAAQKTASTLIQQVFTELSSFMDTTDEKLTQHIADLDKILTNKLASLDIVGTKQINAFETALNQVVRYGSLLILVSACLCIAFFALLKRHPTTSTFSASLGNILPTGGVLSVLAIVFACASTLLTPPSEAKMAEVKSALLTSYRTSMNVGDMNSATFYATQLNSLDAINYPPRLLLQTIDLQRDLLLRPSLVRTAKGIAELQTRIGQLNRTWDFLDDAQVGQISFVRYELAATAAMILWQTSRTYADEIVALCSSLDAMDLFSNFEKGSPDSAVQDASPFMWLAYGYVKWGSVRVDAKAACPDSSAVTIRDQIAKYQPLLTSFDKASPNPIVAPIVVYNRAAANYYSKASQSYAAMLMADAQLNYIAAPLKPGFRTERDNAAAALLGAWTEFGEAIKNQPALQGSDIILSVAGLPAALVERANLLSGTNPPARPAFATGDCNNFINQINS